MAIILNMVFILFGGVFVQNGSTDTFAGVSWLRYCSIYNFAYEILFVNEFHGLRLIITDAEVTVGPITINADDVDGDIILSGDFFIDFFGFERDNLKWDYISLVCWIAAYLIFTYLALAYLNRTKR